jgi:hypothetical protein
MKKCRYEGNNAWAGRCTATREVEPCVGYDKCKNYKPNCKTNADRIRAMTDEELVEWISDMVYGRKTPWSEPFERKFCDNCPTVHGTYENGKEDDFHECDFVDAECPHGSDIVWWLKQPAEEVSNDTT